jgi:hypothetical protein
VRLSIGAGERYARVAAITPVAARMAAAGALRRPSDGCPGDRGTDRAHSPFVCPIVCDRPQSPRMLVESEQSRFCLFAGRSPIASAGARVIRVGEVPGSNPGAPIKAPQMRVFSCSGTRCFGGLGGAPCRYRASLRLDEKPRKYRPSLIPVAPTGAVGAGPRFGLGRRSKKALEMLAFADATDATPTALPAHSLPKLPPDPPPRIAQHWSARYKT